MDSISLFEWPEMNHSDTQMALDLLSSHALMRSRVESKVCVCISHSPHYSLPLHPCLLPPANCLGDAVRK